MTPARPPRFAAWILGWLLPSDRREEILGDLDENHALRRAHFGQRSADRWYWHQTLTTSAALWWKEGGAVMGTILQEARFAVRRFMRKPGFTLITVLTLALGMGANTAIFSVVDGVLLEPLPYPDEAELVSIQHDAPGLDFFGMPSSTGLHVFYTQASASFDALALYSATTLTLTEDGAPERVAAAQATPTLFEVLQAEPILGRRFSEEEGIPDGPKVAVISDGLWAERFGRDPAVVGKTLQVAGVTVEILGVMPADFAFPNPDTRLWIPLRVDPAGADFGGFNYPAIARLKDGVTPAAAQTDLNALVPRLSERFPILFTPEMIANSGIAVDVHPYVDDVVGEVRPVLLVLMATVGFVMLIACANVANLMLVRSEGRSKETAIRSAMGASGTHLLSGHFTESFILAAAGGALGILLAQAGLAALLSGGAQNIPRLEQVGIDPSVLAFTAAVIVLATLVFGVIPLLKGRSSSVADVIRDGTRGATPSRKGSRVRSLLVVSQVAFALILLVGSGLTLRSFVALQHVDPGFDQESVMTFRIPLPSSDYPTAVERAQFTAEFVDRLAAIPGVLSAGAVSHLPLSGATGMDPLLVEGGPMDPDKIPPIVMSRAATPSYFDALGIELVDGRMLNSSDVDQKSGAVLVSQRLVDKFFPGENPVGRRVAQGIPAEHDEWSTIVGVVRDVHNATLTDEPMAVVYYPLVQAEGVNRSWLTGNMGYTLKTSVPPTSIVPAMRQVLAQMDARLPLANVRTMEDRVRDARAPMAFTMLMLALAAGVGLLLGAIGLYGVISYVTAQRTKEIGVRLALGAEAGAVRGMIVRQGMAVTMVGLLAGLAGAYGLSRFMEALLFQIHANDPLTFGGVTITLLFVGLAATWIPAAKAAGADPVSALRSEG